MCYIRYNSIVVMSTTTRIFLSSKSSGLLLVVFFFCNCNCSFLFYSSLSIMVIGGFSLSLSRLTSQRLDFSVHTRSILQNCDVKRYDENDNYILVLKQPNHSTRARFNDANTLISFSFSRLLATL